MKCDRHRHSSTLEPNIFECINKKRVIDINRKKARKALLFRNIYVYNIKLTVARGKRVLRMCSSVTRLLTTRRQDSDDDRRSRGASKARSPRIFRRATSRATGVSVRGHVRSGCLRIFGIWSVSMATNTRASVYIAGARANVRACVCTRMCSD